MKSRHFKLQVENIEEVESEEIPQKVNTRDTAKNIESSDEKKISTVNDQQRVTELGVRMV